MGITIWGWIGLVAGALAFLVGILLMMVYTKEREPGKAVAAFVICLLIAAGLIGGVLIFSNTEAGKRAYKDQTSNFAGGIRRTVTICDINGNVIREYSGEFDAELDHVASYMLFDDENAKRHIIIQGMSSTIFIDEQ